jgi:hypothetical protein
MRAWNFRSLNISMFTQDFTEDFYILVDRFFVARIPWAFSRFNEWEASLLMWKPFVGAWWLWRTSDKYTLLKEDLKKSLDYDNEWFFYWVASKQHLSANTWAKRNIKSENKTFATIFVNNNWKIFKTILENINESVIIVGNEKGKDNKFPFKVKEYIPVPFNVVEYYENNQREVKQIVKTLTRYKNNSLILFCVWPLSNILIYKCWKKNKLNRYIDIWSCLDMYIHWEPSRQYFYKNWKTYNQIDVL